MILREFIYFEKNRAEMQDDNRYISQNDTSVIKSTDLRKVSRLTLKMLNSLRKAGDAHEKEVREERGLIRKMYAAPPPEATPA